MGLNLAIPSITVMLPAQMLDGEMGSSVAACFCHLGMWVVGMVLMA